MRKHIISCSLADTEAKETRQSGANANNAARRGKGTRDSSASESASLPAIISVAAAKGRIHSALLPAANSGASRRTPSAPPETGSRPQTEIVAGGGPSKILRSESQVTTVRGYLRGCRCGTRLNYCVEEHDAPVDELVSIFPNASFKMFEGDQWRALQGFYLRGCDVAKEGALIITPRRMREVSFPYATRWLWYPIRRTWSVLNCLYLASPWFATGGCLGEGKL